MSKVIQFLPPSEQRDATRLIFENDLKEMLLCEEFCCSSFWCWVS
jgi:hypothetical protein